MGKVIPISTMTHLQKVEVEYQPRSSMTDCEICLQRYVVEVAIATCNGVYREAECCGIRFAEMKLLAKPEGGSFDLEFGHRQKFDLLANGQKKEESVENLAFSRTTVKNTDQVLKRFEDIVSSHYCPICCSRAASRLAIAASGGLSAETKCCKNDKCGTVASRRSQTVLFQNLVKSPEATFH